MFWDRFEKLCREAGKKPSPVGKEIGVSATAVYKWKDGTIPNGEILMKIADYFNCSTDYLLGRTDEPSANTSIIKTGDINSSSNIGNNNNISISATAEAENEISSILSGLNPRERTELMMMIYQFADNHNV